MRSAEQGVDVWENSPTGAHAVRCFTATGHECYSCMVFLKSCTEYSLFEQDQPSVTATFLRV